MKLCALFVVAVLAIGPLTTPGMANTANGS